MTIVTFLLLAAPAARAATLSVFVPVDNGCEWRFVSFPAAETRVVAHLERCPEKLVWLGDRAVLGTGQEILAGDWKTGQFQRVRPPLPLPTRGRLEKVGFDAKGRPMIVVSDPLLSASDHPEVPGLKDGATHIGSVHALEDGEWRMLLREKVAFGGTSAGIDELAAKIDWSTGTSLGDRIATMAPDARAPRLVLRKGRVFAEGPKKRVFLMQANAASSLDSALLAPNPSARTYYAALPVQKPVKWVIAKVDDNPWRFLLPVLSVDVDSDDFLAPLDGQARSTPGLAIAVQDGVVLTSDRLGSRWPKAFVGKPRWKGQVYEEPSGTGAVFFP